jgi:hypothetical protein
LSDSANDVCAIHSSVSGMCTVKCMSSTSVLSSPVTLSPSYNMPRYWLPPLRSTGKTYSVAAVEPEPLSNCLGVGLVRPLSLFTTVTTSRARMLLSLATEPQCYLLPRVTSGHRARSPLPPMPMAMCLVLPKLLTDDKAHLPVLIPWWLLVEHLELKTKHISHRRCMAGPTLPTWGGG